MPSHNMPSSEVLLVDGLLAIVEQLDDVLVQLGTSMHPSAPEIRDVIAKLQIERQRLQAIVERVMPGQS